MRAILSAVLILQQSSFGAGFNVSSDKNVVAAREGGTAELICSGDRKVDFCEFTTAQGEDRPLLGNDYPRLKQIKKDSRQECGIQITNVTKQVFHSVLL